MRVVGVSWALLLIIGIAAMGLVGLVKVLSSPQTGPAVKVLILLPLTVVGLLLLAFVVLTATYRFSRVERPATAIRVDDPANEAQVSVSSNGMVAMPGRRARVSVSAHEVPPPAAAGQPLPAVRAATGSSQAQPAVAASATSAAGPMAAKRPDWVDNPPQPHADLYELVVKAGPWKTPLDCEQELDEKIAWAVDSYVAWRIDDEAGSQVQLPAEYAREHVVKAQWLEKINTSLGEMYNLHALLNFDRQVEGKLQDMWSHLLLGARLLLSAAILGGVLLILTVIYGYLKIDLATRGAYRGRLRFVAAATILALTAAGAALWRWNS